MKAIIAMRPSVEGEQYERTMQQGEGTTCVCRECGELYALAGKQSTFSKTHCPKCKNSLLGEMGKEARRRMKAEKSAALRDKRR